MTAKKMVMVLTVTTLILSVAFIQNAFAGKVIIQNNSQEMLSINTRSKTQSHNVYVQKNGSDTENWFIISSITHIIVGKMENPEKKTPYQILKKYTVTETDPVTKFRQDYKVIVSDPAESETDVKIILLPLPDL